MSGGFAELHDELRAVARDLLAGSAPTAAGGSAGPPVDWSLLAESGWLGLEAPEALDGAGATFAETAVILEELGRAAAVAPYLGTVVLGVGALLLAEPTSARDDLLRRAVAGEARLAVALGDGAADAVPPVPAFRIEATAEGHRLTGAAGFVPDACSAHELLLVATDPAGEPVLVGVVPGRSGVEVDAQPLLDATRELATVRADVVVPADAVWRFADARTAPGRLFDRGALAVACDGLGLGRAMLDATVAYASVRRQFGRPIGSFQAVKHACADMLVQLTVAEELVGAAVEAVVAGDPQAGRAVSMAAAHVGGAAVEVVGKALQLHGGIGYTWESGIHVHLKRAVLDRSLFGSPAAHRRRLAASLAPR